MVSRGLVAQGEALGVLHVGARAQARAPGVVDATRRRAEAVAAHLALGVANVKLRDVLRSQSIRDPLTGLFNRRHMEETL
ncbi:MAG: GGDEF domain-containing protein [Candidatus Rokubacteria bacterium]|nr:GGDEF domain-containing protein [Candidatus Rokubacteria bacterium]